MKRVVITTFLLITTYTSFGQSVIKTMFRLPDTGENTSYTSTFGEDADYSINTPFFTINGNGTVTDTITGLMWQRTDGGEMTIENAITYCDTLTLGGFTDWRLPKAHEGFSILNHQFSNPATDNAVFTTTDAEYWWSSDRQANDNTKVWVTNWGGGIGNHPKTETISAGGTKKFHVRAVRDVNIPTTIPNHFTDNGNGTITDNLTKLVWQKLAYADTLNWEQALTYAESMTLAGTSDWRLPNIKELRSINDESLIGPSVNISFFSNILVNKYWSSTTLPNQVDKAWYLDTQFGITTYALKTSQHYLLCVRGPQINTGLADKNEIKNDVKIFPNPVGDILTVSTNGTFGQPVKLEIYNVMGQLIQSEDIGTHEKKFINTASFKAGIYIMIIIFPHNIYMEKFVKD